MTIVVYFFFNDTATTEIYTLSLHDALPISRGRATEHSCGRGQRPGDLPISRGVLRELQDFLGTVCGLEGRRGLCEVASDADGELPLDAERAAGGDAGDCAELGKRGLSEKSAGADTAGGTKDPDRRTGNEGR